MSNYEKIFEPYYEGGWEAYPLETTLITAGALNDYDAAIMHIEDYLDTQVDPNDNLAETYSNEETYEAGDYRIYNGVLYKCLEDIDEAEDFDPTKWEACFVTDEMATSGGTTVIANPSGQATETLTKLQVENTIYGISGGGGNANIWTGTQAELEEVFDELEEGTQINITDDEQEVVDGGTIYSEDEQVIGLWTDNKPIYQKTFVTEKTNIVGNTAIDVNSDITPLNVGDIIGYENKLEYSLSGGSGKYWSDDLARLRQDNTNGYTILLTIGGATLTTLKIEWTIQYTKSTDAPLDVVIGKSTMYIASSDCYSTEEKEVGCYTDGKPIYQKTWTGLNVTPAYNNWTNIISNDDNIEKIVKWSALSGEDYKNIEGSGIEIQATSSYIRAEYNQNANVRAINVLTLQYTKTTDTAGSGQYTPASGKAVHYSTDEQVIGTWIDGKPLYRKVLPPQSFNNTDVTYTHNLGVKHYINVYGSCTVNNGTAPRAFPYRQTRYNAYCEWNGATANDITFSATWSGNVVNAVLEYTKESDYSA